MRKNKFIKTIITLVIISMIVIIPIIVTSCLPVSQEGSTTVATNPDGTPVEPSWFAQYGTWLWIIILIVAFYFLLIRPQRQRSKTQQDLMSNLQRGDEIITVGGIYGKIKDVGGDSMIITISSGVDIKISKSSIARKVLPDVPTSSSSLKNKK